MKKIHGAVINTNIFLAALCVVKGYNALLYAELVIWFGVTMYHSFIKPEEED